MVKFITLLLTVIQVVIVVIALTVKSIGVYLVVLHRLLLSFGVVADLVAALAAASRVCLVDLVLILERHYSTHKSKVVGVSSWRLQNPLAAHSVVVVFKVVRVTSVVKTAPHKLLSDLTSVQKVVYQERLAVMHTGILISDASIEFTGQVVVDTILLLMVLTPMAVMRTLKDIQDFSEFTIHPATAGRRWEWLIHHVYLIMTVDTWFPTSKEMLVSMMVLSVKELLHGRMLLVVMLHYLV
jgi:hypothetical protein